MSDYHASTTQTDGDYDAESYAARLEDCNAQADRQLSLLGQPVSRHIGKPSEVALAMMLDGFSVEMIAFRIENSAFDPATGFIRA